VKILKKKVLISLVFSLIFSVGPFFLFNFHVESNEYIEEMFQQKIYEEFNDLPSTEYYDIYDSKYKMCYK
jgi:hypothetical protein